MFKPMPESGSEPEYASDLDWMLQSGQADPAMLAEALIEVYFSDLLRLSEAFLGDEVVAREAVRGTLITALVNGFRYRESDGVRRWVYRLAIRELRNALYWTWAFQFFEALRPARRRNEVASTTSSSLDAALRELDPSVRLICLLKYLNDLPEEEIAHLLRVERDAVHAQLASAVGEFRRAGVLAPAGVAREELESGEQEDFHEVLGGLLKTRWPEKGLAGERLEALVGEVVARAGRRQAVQRRWNAVKEAGLISLAVLLVLGVLWGMNRWLPEAEPAATPMPTRVIAAGRSVRTPIPERLAPTEIPTPTPAGVFYTVQAGEGLEDVSRRLRISPQELARLNRLPIGSRLEAGQLLVIPASRLAGAHPTFTPVPPVTPSASLGNSPPGDIGSHMQLGARNWKTVWFDALVREYSSRSTVQGRRFSRLQAWFAEDRILILAGHPDGEPDTVYLLEGQKAYVARPGAGQPWFGEFSFEGNFLDAVPFSSSLRQIFNTQPYADSRRPWRVSRRVLGMEEAAGRDAWLVKQVVRSFRRESMLWVDVETGLTLHAQEFGNPLIENALLREVRISAIQYNVDLPEELFDLSLPWRGGFAQDPSGRAGLGNLESMICQRSPDGDKIAFVSDPSGRPPQDAALNWYSLSDPEQDIRQPLGGVRVTRFAFAPDSRRMAVFGYDGQYAIGSLLLLDSENSERKLLAHLVDLRSMAWSRRGDFLALIGAPRRSGRYELVLLQVESGQVVYRQRLDLAEAAQYRERWVQGMPAAWWHAFTPTVQFPIRMGGAESCAAPPA